MPVAILLILIILPMAEIAVFILVGEEIGVWRTIALVFLSAFAGIMLLRVQGLVTLTRVRAALNRGETPAAELFRGACLLAAGILLLIPGFLTDAIGLLLLLPPVRDGLRRALGRGIGVRGPGGQRPGGRGPGGPRAGGQGHGGRGPARPGPVIEGDFEELPTREGDRNPDGFPPEDDSGRGPGRDGEPRR